MLIIFHLQTFSLHLKVFTSGVDSSSVTSSNICCCCGGDGDSESSVVTGRTVGESGCVTCLAVGGEAASGRSDCWLICVSRLLSCFLLIGVGGTGGVCLSATGGGGGGSVGATSCLIGGGESGGVAGFPGCFGGSEQRSIVRSVEEILGFGGRGGLDVGRWFSSGVSLNEGRTEV